MLNDYSMKENHMSKNYYKTEEAPPLKKSIIHKVEKQYGKDNPKTYATLWSIYKKKKKNEDVPGTSTAGVVGTGDDVADFKKKKKGIPHFFKKKRKNSSYIFKGKQVGEGYQEISNLVDITQGVMTKMIKAMKKDDFKSVNKLYKELGNIIK